MHFFARFVSGFADIDPLWNMFHNRITRFSNLPRLGLLPLISQKPNGYEGALGAVEAAVHAGAGHKSRGIVAGVLLIPGCDAGLLAGKIAVSTVLAPPSPSAMCRYPNTHKKITNSC